MAIDRAKLLPRSSRTTTQKMDSARKNATRENSVTEKQYVDLTRSVAAINRNLIGISNLLKLDMSLDKSERSKKLAAEKREQDQNKKINKEKFLEGKVTKALTNPIKKIGESAKIQFNKFFEALGILFFGWLADKGGKAIKAFKEGDHETLKKIKNNLIKVSLVAVGVIAAFTFGIPLIVSGITSLVSAIIASIPAVLSLLANPVVWMGIAAILATRQMQSGTEREISKAVAAADGDRSVVIAQLKDELKLIEEGKPEGKLGGNLFGDVIDDIKANTKIAEIKKQIAALELGYHGTGDPRYREAGFEGNPMLNSFEKDDKRWLWQGDKKLPKNYNENLVKEAKKNKRSDIDKARLAALTGLYRDAARIRQLQEEYKQMKKDNPKAAEGADGNIAKLEVQFQQNLQKIVSLKRELPPEHNEIINKLALRILNMRGMGKRSDEKGPDGKFGTLDDVVKDPEVYEQLARIMARIYPELDKPYSKTGNFSSSQIGLSDGNSMSGTTGNIDENTGKQDGTFTPIEDIDNVVKSAKKNFSESISSFTNDDTPIVNITPVDSQSTTNAGGVGGDSGPMTTGIDIATNNTDNDYLYHYINVYAS